MESTNNVYYTLINVIRCWFNIYIIEITSFNVSVYILFSLDIMTII